MTTTKLITNRSTYVVTQDGDEWALTIEASDNEVVQPYVGNSFAISAPSPWPPELLHRPVFRFKSERTVGGKGNVLQIGLIKSIETEKDVPIEATE